jgi:ABC-type nitrate/sulfonate/bicarbonate transport system permease component
MKNTETGVLRISGARVLRYLGEHPNLIRIASVTAFTLLWEFFGRNADPLFMSYPSAIARAGVEMVRSGELQDAIVVSMVPFMIGLTISLITGIVIGLLIGQFEFLEYTLDPYINALLAIPRVALVPLIILWFGLEIQGKIVIIVSVAMFPVIVNTYAGVKDIRGSLLEIGRAYGATELQTFFKIVLPAALPFIMVGVRLAVGYGIIGMIVAEFFTAIRGLGGLIVFYSNNFATAKLFVPIIVVGVMGIGLTQTVLGLERWLSPWRESERLRG